ncbi:hypothetical protein BDD12DRAFT_841026 [Trichophaea hybrida]|nr:hypothetical protein BDD12DRAFT_841026 [Trichophaea hybrida]
MSGFFSVNQSNPRTISSLISVTKNNSVIILPAILILSLTHLLIQECLPSKYVNLMACFVGRVLILFSRMYLLAMNWRVAPQSRRHLVSFFKFFNLTKLETTNESPPIVARKISLDTFFFSFPGIGATRLSLTKNPPILPPNPPSLRPRFPP